MGSCGERCGLLSFFFNDTATTEIYTLSLHDALPIYIKARNYNLDIKNPYVGEQINHDPDELLANFAKQQSEIREIRNQLKDILADALERK